MDEQLLGMVDDSVNDAAYLANWVYLIKIFQAGINRRMQCFILSLFSQENFGTCTLLVEILMSVGSQGGLSWC